MKIRKCFKSICVSTVSYTFATRKGQESREIVCACSLETKTQTDNFGLWNLVSELQVTKYNTKKKIVHVRVQPKQRHIQSFLPSEAKVGFRNTLMERACWLGKLEWGKCSMHRSRVKCISETTLLVTWRHHYCKDYFGISIITISMKFLSRV